MAKEKKTPTNKKKDIKRKSIVDEKDLGLTPDLNYLMWISIVVLVIFFVFYFLAVAKSDYEAPKKNEDSEETTIQYTKILAGTSFNRSGSEYLVIYYDMSDNENEDTSSLNSAVSSYQRSSSDLILYTCDLSNSFNKSYVTTEEVNKSPLSAEDLSINGPTIIKFSDGKVTEYIQGKNEVESYLSNLNSD